MATEECVADDTAATSVFFSGTPTAGDGFAFSVRGAYCAGTYDSGGASQAGQRDAEIAASGNVRP